MAEQSNSSGCPTRRSLLISGVALSAEAILRPALAKSPARDATASSLPGTSGSSVYLLRGFGGLFSAGIDEIHDRLRSAGVHSHIGGHFTWRSVAKAISARQAEAANEPVVLIGHSLGANSAISIAETLDRKNVRVRYLVTFAATAPEPLPGNIEHAVNFYFSHDGWGEPLIPGLRFKGRLENRDFAGLREIGHFNIDKQPLLQDEVIQETLAILKRP